MIEKFAMHPKFSVIQNRTEKDEIWKKKKKQL